MIYIITKIFDPEVTIGLAFASMGMREKLTNPYALWESKPLLL